MHTPHRHYNEQRFTKVLDYLHRHYQGDINLSRLAEEACLSPYHWHRIYHAVMGETVHETVKRLRLHHAARLLANTDRTLSAIARECGYSGNVQSFGRIFRQAYGVSPQNYRQNSGVPYREQHQNRSGIMYEVEIKTLNNLPVALMDHHGDYMRIGETFAKLESLLTLRGQLPGSEARFFGIYYDDPHSTPEQELFAQAAVFTGETHHETPVKNGRITGGRYAVLHYRGPYAGLDKAYQWFYREWLLNSPYEVGDAPCVEEYLNDVQTTAPQDLLTDIYISLAD